MCWISTFWNVGFLGVLDVRRAVRCNEGSLPVLVFDAGRVVSNEVYILLSKFCGPLIGDQGQVLANPKGDPIQSFPNFTDSTFGRRE